MTRRAALILEEVAAAHAEMLLTLQGAQGHLRLGVYPVAVPEMLVAMRQHLHRSMPDLVISVHEGVETSLLTGLSHGQLDCVIGRIVQEELTPDLRHEVLFHEPAVIVCGVAHPVLRARKSQRLTHLAESAWILPTLKGASYQLVASRLALEGLPAPRVAMEMVSVFATVEVLNSSRLLAIFPAAVARSLAQGGRVGVVPIAPLSLLYPVGLMYRQQEVLGDMVQIAIAAARRAAAARTHAAAPSGMRPRRR